MEMTLIIIILLLIGAFNLTLITGALVYTILFKFRDTPSKCKPNSTNAVPTAPQTKEDAYEKEEMRRRKKAYEDQLGAINEMLNYNADVAYGIKPKDEY